MNPLKPAPKPPPGNPPKPGPSEPHIRTRDKGFALVHVRFVPQADSCTAAKARPLFDHLVGAGE
jgi:hypothetical protein